VKDVEGHDGQVFEKVIWIGGDAPFNCFEHIAGKGGYDVCDGYGIKAGFF